MRRVSSHIKRLPCILSLAVNCFIPTFTIVLICLSNETVHAGGRIKGVAKLCIAGDVDGTVVYIPGKSFFVKTDANGQFVFLMSRKENMN